MKNELFEKIAKIKVADSDFEKKARERWQTIAKPLGSLGVFEDAICRLASCQKTLFPQINRRVLAVFCADNGIVAEGVSQSTQEVTTAIVKSLCDGKSSACALARVANCKIVPVDMGIASKIVDKSNLVDLHIQRGTKNFLKEDAMTLDECQVAILNGFSLAERLSGEADIFLTGEMGIGNTTTSAAVLSALLNLDAKDVAGKGAGLSDSALLRKIDVIRRALVLRKIDREDALGVLAKVGGFDIAGMVGFFLGSAFFSRPIIVDGLISACAALVATRLCPAVQTFLIASHKSSEKASAFALKELRLCAPLDAQLHLGEGSGALFMLPLLDMALEVYKTVPIFEKIGIEAYKPL